MEYLIDHHKADWVDDLNKFVNNKLFPCLKKFNADSDNANTLEYKIGVIFNELKNKIQRGRPIPLFHAEYFKICLNSFKARR